MPSNKQTLSEAQAQPDVQPKLRAVIPARYSAWLSGDLGRRIARDLHVAMLDIHDIPDLTVRRIAGGIVAAADEHPGSFVESLASAMRSVERRILDQCPAMRAELGPVFTGSLQVILPDPEFRINLS